MHSILHILNTSTELMSAVELMSGAKSRKWVHQKPTNQPTNQVKYIIFGILSGIMFISLQAFSRELSHLS